MNVEQIEWQKDRILAPDCINKDIALLIRSGYNSTKLLQTIFTTIILNFQLSILHSL